VKKGAKVIGGDALGVVQETPLVEHKILVPPEITGVLNDVCSEGEEPLKAQNRYF